MIWFISLLISMATVLYIAGPYLFNRHTAVPAAAGSEGFLLSRRNSLLRSLKELEFDRRTNKIDEEEFQALRTGLATEASDIIATLEKTSNPGLRNGSADSLAEQLIRQARQSPTSPRVADQEDAAERLIRMARSQAQPAENSQPAAAGWKCECGRTRPVDDRFCASCGKPRL